MNISNFSCNYASQLFLSPHQSQFLYPLYKTIAREFVKCYYSIYDNNFMDLANLFITTPSITFGEFEFNNFYDWVKKIIQKYDVNKFHHTNITYEAQPIGENILINISGNLKLNNGQDQGKYNETILLVKTSTSTYSIANVIFRVC